MTELPLADGLLEQPVLRLGPCRPPAAQVLATPGGQVVGSARWRASRTGWRRLLPGLRLAVHEALDDPLLFTVHRAWDWRAWYEVRDADERPVGRFLDSGARLWDRFGDALAQGEGNLFVAQRGLVLAEWLPGAEGGELHFRQELDPFAKMLLLAAALVALERAGS